MNAESTPLKKILVTGSSGHAGRAIAQHLGGRYEIVGIDMQPGPFTHHVGSLLDKQALDYLTSGVSAVVHTASLHAPHIDTHSRAQFVDTNIRGTLRLLEAAQANGVPKFVYTSSTSLYGERLANPDQAVWVTEALHPVPRDIYDITKIAAESLCKDFFDPNTFQTSVLRVARFWDEPLALKVFYRMYRGLDVRDVALAHELAINHDFAQFDIFNISAQPIFGQEDLSGLMGNTKAVLQKRIPQIFGFYEQQGWVMPTQIDRVYVIDKAKEILGYQPQYNIDAIVKQQ